MILDTKKSKMRISWLDPTLYLYLQSQFMNLKNQQLNFKYPP